MLHHCAILPGVLLLLSLSVAGNAWGIVQYHVIDLGCGTAHGINAAGQVVGATNDYHGDAWLYSDGTTTMLGADAVAYGINDSGTVVGSSPAIYPPGHHAFVYAAGTMTMLGPPIGYTYNSATAINADGHVVGFTYDLSDHQHAFLFSDGKASDLGTLPEHPYSAANDINVDGQIVGGAYGGNDGCHAFICSNGQMTDLNSLIDSRLGWFLADANSINDNGQVVGAGTTGGENHAYLYSDGDVVDLGSLEGGTWVIPREINNHGQVVGQGLAIGDALHAFLYSNGTMTDLNSLIAPASGWTLTEATAINDNGWIVGVGSNVSGAERAFLLVPVPEPSSLILFTIAMVEMLSLFWRRRPTQ